MNIQTHRAPKVGALPGYKVFLKHFEELAEIPTDRSEELESKRSSIETQLAASKSFEKFLSRERGKIVAWMNSTEAQQTIKAAQQIFDQVVRQSVETLAHFGEKSIEVIQGVDDDLLKLELTQLANEIIKKGTSAIQSYQMKREALFLGGLFSVYKNALARRKMLKIRFEDLKLPQTLDMIKTVSGPVKVITDSLIPSFVEALHRKVVTPRIVGTSRKLKPLCTSLDDNYRSRGFAKSQSQYFDAYKAFHDAVRDQLPQTNSSAPATHPPPIA